MTERDPIFTRLRSFWEAADPMPADLPDTMIARVWAASLDEAYEHLVLIEQTTQLVGSRGAAASVDAPATASALLMQFGSGADKVLPFMQDAAGNPAAQKVARKRVALMGKERVPVREHVELQNADGQKIGETTSGLLGPSIDQPIAMGYVSPEYAAVGTPVFALVRGKQIPMEVAATPFVPNRYHRG